MPALLPITTHVRLQGSGWSEGDYVTLGKREQDDLEVAIQYLRSSGTVTTIGLWGRSMGAVTAILYAHKDPSMACLVRGTCRPWAHVSCCRGDLTAAFLCSPAW